MEVDSQNDVFNAESFWDVDFYKKTVKRTADGFQNCYDIVKMCQERADLEKEYAKKLKAWSRKWTEFYDKSSEYGSTKNSIKESLTEADKLADVHLIIKERLGTDIQQQVKEWRNEHYNKQMVGNCKEAKQFEEDFKRAQKPWKSRSQKMQKCRKDYHNACKQEKSSLNQENNAKNNTEISLDQLRKFQERVDKSKKEVILTKEKYEQSLMELSNVKNRYTEDMIEVFQRTQEFEEKRLNFIKAILFRIQASIDLTKFPEIPRIYSSMSDSITDLDPRRDLKWWAQSFGPDMPASWPVFEEYTTEFHNITNKSNKNCDSGVTLTYHHKNDTYLNSVEANQLANRSSMVSSTSSNRSSQLNPIPEDEYDNVKQTNNGFAWDTSVSAAGSHARSSVVGGGVMVRALYDYDGKEKDELTLRVGDVFVKLKDRDEQGWCTGRKDNVVGLYPDNYVELLSENPF